MTTKGIYHTLVTQLDKLARHNRQGSFRTKDRYYEAVKRFCAYLANHYHLQKLENISGKHQDRAGKPWSRYRRFYVGCLWTRYKANEAGQCTTDGTVYSSRFCRMIQ